VVVFASASCWGSPPRKAAWERLKENGAGIVLFTLCIYVYLKNLYYSYSSFDLLLFALPAFNTLKNKGKILPIERTKKQNISRGE
jgi:hypothetical protein